MDQNNPDEGLRRLTAASPVTPTQPTNPFTFIIPQPGGLNSTNNGSPPSYYNSNLAQKNESSLREAKSGKLIKRKEGRSNTKCVVLILVLTGLFTYLTVTKKTNIFIHWFVAQMKKISNIPEPARSLAFFGLLLVLQMSYIPFQSTFIVVMSFCLKSFLLSMLLQMASNLLSCTATYLLARNCCNKALHKRYKNDLLYKVVMNESGRNPWKINVMLRIIFIPVAFKNTLVGLAKIPYLVVISCYFVSLVLLNPLYTMIGVNLNKVEDYLNPKSFAQKSAPEKIKLVLGYIIMLLTVVIFTFLYCYTRKKLAEYRVAYSESEDSGSETEE